MFVFWAVPAPPENLPFWHPIFARKRAACQKAVFKVVGNNG